MCGRYNFVAESGAVAEEFGLAALPTGLAPRYNVAPTQLVAAVGLGVGRRTRGLVRLRWGMVPNASQNLSGANVTRSVSEGLFAHPR